MIGVAHRRTIGHDGVGADPMEAGGANLLETGGVGTDGENAVAVKTFALGSFTAP